MTVKELKDRLNEVSEDIEVNLCVDGTYFDIESTEVDEAGLNLIAGEPEMDEEEEGDEEEEEED